MALLSLCCLAVGLAVTPAAARATPASLARRAATIADAISLEWSHSINQAGWIVDPVSGQAEGGYGQAMLAYGMVRATQRDPARDLIPIAAAALADSDSVAEDPFKLLGGAEALISAGNALGPTTTAIIEHAALTYPFFRGSTSGACGQRARCYNNVDLVNATGVLATAVALSQRSAVAGSTLAAQARAIAQARLLLSVTIPRVQRVTGRLLLGPMRVTGAMLSDPPADPTAYLALSAMMLGRSLQLAGQPLPAAARAFGLAVVELLGLVAPNGDISYMGRGQGQVWTMAASAAACGLAMRLLPAQRALAERCEGLIDTELGALDARRSLGGFGIATVPRLTWTRGVDSYVNRTDYNGLCVYALNLTADALQGLHDPGERAVPGATDGESFDDDEGAGLATTDLDGLWFAVHRLDADGADSRWGFGLMAMQRLDDGTWKEAIPDRPLGPGTQGPTLLVGGRRLEPIGQSMQVTPGRIAVQGGWGAGGRLVRRATFEYRATAGGVVLTVAARPGDTLVVGEWMPPGQPGMVSTSAPGVRELVHRRALAEGDDASDSVDEIEHTVRVTRAATVAITWHG